MLHFIFKWTLICLVIGFFAGSASAFFLVSLDWVTEWRESHLWAIALLPVAGFIVGALYYYLGKEVEKGNKLLIENIHQPSGIIPFKMAPLVLITTLITHLSGGSAGREGTAVQMSGAMSDQLTPLFKLTPEERRFLLIAAISAGFASVFGTPLAGTVFALEVAIIGNLRYKAIYPSVLAAFSADFVTQHIWNVGHTHYSIPEIPDIAPLTILYSLLTGALCGLTAFAFIKTHHFFSELFKKNIIYPPIRPLVGGLILAFVFYLIYCYLNTSKYTGLGVPVIVDAFRHTAPPYDFILKLLLTAFTLGCGFKGGEVTPLFFIGAVLGSALSVLVPLPVALLAGMGFVAVFAGAANTPLACFLMALELFGTECGIFAALACITAYFCSGKKGIYR